MTGEAVSDICVSIALEARKLRTSGKPVSRSLMRKLNELCFAPATTTADALALMAVVRKILISNFDDEMLADLSGLDDDQALTFRLFLWVHRAVEILETQTGLSAEGFTGESDDPIN